MGRYYRSRRAVTGLLVAMVLLGVTGWAAAAGSAPPAASHPSAGTDDLTVTVGSAFAFTTSTDYITPGDTVNLTVVQTDTGTHTFTLLSVANFSFSPTLNSSDQINAFLAAHPPIVNISIPATPGQVQLNFQAPALGVYQFLCLIPGHFQAGMWGLLGSGVQVSQPNTNTGAGAPVFIITGTIVGLVVLAIVLGFVIGRRRGSTDEMPPERLGYPEPPGPAEPRK